MWYMEDLPKEVCNVILLVEIKHLRKYNLCIRKNDVT